MISILENDEYSAFAFYGMAGGEQPVTYCFETMNQWFTELGHPPDKLSVHGSGHSGKIISFTRGMANLRRTGFSQVFSFFIYSMIPDGKTERNEDLLSASFYFEPEDSWSVVCAHPSLASLTHDSMFPVAKALLQQVSPQYGIGYKRIHRRGPELYAIGIGMNSPSSGSGYEESLLDSRWCDTGMPKCVYREGILRNVFPWNFLNRKQLNMNVGDKSLEQWISQKAKRGSLVSVSESLSFWEVEDSEIPAIRQELWDAGLIFNWRNYL
jgi:hypothetical protein